MNIGPRIKLARARAQMSMRQLGQAVGVSATAISKFEKGEVAPRQSTLIRLATALTVGVEYFFRDVKVEGLTPAYRKLSRLGKLIQDSIEAAIIDEVERYLTAEQLFPEGRFPRFILPRYEVENLQDAEEAALNLRKEWDLGTDPIEDLCGRLENRGVKVIVLDAVEGFDGFSCWVNGNVPVIAYNSSVPGDRQRFSLAHELGHLVLNLRGVLEVEKAAHRFAAAFLVPADAARRELGSQRTNLSFKELQLLKREYGISIQAWMRRAFDLGIINETVYTMLCRRLSAMGWRKQEPNSVPTEKPRRLQLIIHQAEAEDLISHSYAAVLLGGIPRNVHRQEKKKLTSPGEDLIREYEYNPELTAFLNIDLDDLDAEDS